MSTLTVALPAGPWTVEDLARIPSSDVRVELHDGHLILAPAAATPWHSRTQLKLTSWLQEQGWHVLHEAGVILDRGARTADVGVFRNEPAEHPYHPASAFVIAVEVVSAATAETDYRVKPALYAAAGIPAFWLVDRHPEVERDAVVKIHELRLVPDPTYVCTDTVALSDLKSRGLPRPA